MEPVGVLAAKPPSCQSGPGAPKSADPTITPGGLLPFSITQQQASSDLSQWLSSRWFAPNELRYFAQPEAIHGVYLPFWSYTTHATTDYTGQRGDYYYDTETYYERDAQGRQVLRTRQGEAHSLVSSFGNC